MDIFAHALWALASAGVAGRKLRPRMRLPRVAAWGILPDVVTFAVPAVVRIWRLATGASKSLLPDGSGPRFDWVWNLYNATHSAILFAVAFGAVWLILRRPVWEMLGWALHVLIDIFTHNGLFAVQFLWPLSAIHVDGARWEAGWLLAANYAALAAAYVLLWIFRRNETLPRPIPAAEREKPSIQ